MRTHATFLGFASLLMLVLLSTASAQGVNKQLIANIPFQFTVGSETLSAGRYEVTVANPSSDQRVLKLRNLDKPGTAISITHAVQSKASDESHLVFHRFGDQYFLAQVWTVADGCGMELSRSKTERRLENELACIKPENETIALRKP